MNRRHSITYTSPLASAADQGHSQHEHDRPPRVVNDSITVAIDGGASRWWALDWAAAEASATHADLRIMHAISWPRWGLDQLGGLALDCHDTDAPEHGTLILDEAARRARVIAPQTTITTRLETGETRTAILRSARDGALIVIRHGRRLRRNWSFVERAAHRLAHRPISISTTAANSISDEDSR